jgi:hypothetical protein
MFGVLVRLTSFMTIRIAAFITLLVAANPANAQVAMGFTTWGVQSKTVGKTTRFELVANNVSGGARGTSRTTSKVYPLGTVPATKLGACRSGQAVADQPKGKVIENHRELGFLVHDQLPDHLAGDWPRSGGNAGMQVFVARCDRDHPEYVAFFYDHTVSTLSIVFVADDAVIAQASGYRPAPKRAPSPFIHLGKTPHWLSP